VVLAENQLVIARALEAAGGAVVLTSLREQLQLAISEIDAEALAGISRRASQLVDGLGCRRVVGELVSGSVE
jgi:hypothetical protein